MTIIEYKKDYQENVKDLLVQLQEFIVDIDKDNLNILTKDYREKYFKYTLLQTYKNNGKIFLAKENDKIVGMIACHIREYEEMDKLDYKCHKMGIVQELIVDSNCCGGGIGKELVSYAEQYLKSIGCEYCMLDVFAYNEKGHSFYKSQGYKDRMTTMLKKF